MAQKPQAALAGKTAGARRRAPVRYSQELGKRICARLARGERWFEMAGEAGLPEYSSLYAWKARHPEFAEGLAKAREMAADYCADLAISVAEGMTKETVQRDRVLIDALLKRAAVTAPATWGGKGDVVSKKDKPQQVAVVFYARQFEKVIGPDGKAFVREIKREDEA